QARPVGELERTVEQRDRRRDARKLVAAHTEPEQHIRPVDVVELLAFRQISRLLEQLERLVEPTFLCKRPGLAGQAANIELRRARRADLLARALKDLERLGVTARLGERLGTRKRRLDAV